MKTKIILLISLLIILASNAQTKKWAYVSKNNSIIVDGKARFTFLTPRMIRLEYDSTQTFVNDRSFVVVNRNLEGIPFTKSRQGKWVVIKSAQLELRYKEGSG